jgi:hypothetical protein
MNAKDAHEIAMKYYQYNENTIKFLNWVRVKSGNGHFGGLYEGEISENEMEYLRSLNFITTNIGLPKGLNGPYMVSW